MDHRQAALFAIIGLLTVLIAEPVLTTVGYGSRALLLTLIQIGGAGIAIIGGSVLLYKQFRLQN